MIDQRLESDKPFSREEMEHHLTKIEFFQHERLIHLIVTMFYALFTLLFIYLCLFSWLFIIIVLALLCFLIAYVLHYFFLENNVQYLYKQYDRMLERKK